MRRTREIPITGEIEINTRYGYSALRKGLVTLMLFFAVMMSPPHTLAATGRSVSAGDFGAFPDDNIDDTVALQNALNYLATNLIADAGGCLILPEGQYDITNRLVFNPTNPAGASQGITIRGNGRDAPSASTIYSTSTNGALLFNIGIYTNLTSSGTLVPYEFNIQMQDMQFIAGIADAGPAIEMKTMQDNDPGEGDVTVTNRLFIVPYMRNVKITRDNINCYYTYGIKGKWIARPVFINLFVLGHRPGMKAGLSLDAHYSYNVIDGFLKDMEVGVDTTRGAEGNSIHNTLITNVIIGARMTIDMQVSGPSGSGGAIMDSEISASQIGMHVKGKQFLQVNNSVFSRWGGSGGYTNIYWDGVHQSMISDNIFVGGPNQKGIVFADTTYYSADSDTIAYNVFGSLATSVELGTNVGKTHILDNFFSQTNIVDAGTETYIAHGAPREFYESPASHFAEESLRWNGLLCGTVVNITNHSARGDGLTDDTTAITNALAQLKANLASSGAHSGTLYFPAGRYKITKRLDLVQQGANWQKITICGDGPNVSVIVANTTNGVFKINCTNQVAVTIHNIGLEAVQANAGTAIELTQQGAAVDSTARSLILHGVEATRLNVNKYFRTGFVGQGLARPLFDRFRISTCGKTNTVGLSLSGGYGADFQRCLIKGAIQPGIIDSLGGAINVRGAGFAQNGVTGLTVNAGGGTFALYHAHINSQNNFVLSNASTASFMNVETLWADPDTADQTTETLRFSNCTNIYVRNCFLNSANTVLTPNCTHIVLAGNQNKNVDVSGNMFRFRDNYGVGMQIDAGTENLSVYDNLFVNTPAFDIDNDEPSANISMRRPMDVRPELAGYWDLNDGLGSTAYGRCYVQNGAISGATWTAGKYGDYGLYFHGTSDKVQTTEPQFKEVMSNFTMMAWVKPEKAISGGNRTSNQSYVFTLVNGDDLASDGVTNVHRGVALTVGTNEIRVVEHGTISSGLDTVAKITQSVSLSSTAWTHVAVTYSNGAPRLYTNGVLAAAGTATSGKIPHPGCNFGGSPSWGPYKGSMDEMRVLNRPLSAAEIVTEMAKTGIED